MTLQLRGGHLRRLKTCHNVVFAVGSGVVLYYSRGRLRVSISTVPDPSGSGQVDMLTSPVGAARAAVATGAWVKSKRGMYLIRGSVGS